MKTVCLIIFIAIVSFPILRWIVELVLKIILVIKCIGNEDFAEQALKRLKEMEERDA